MTRNISLRKAGLTEVADLQQLCKETYSLYFAGHWVGPGLELYLEEQFGSKVLKTDLQGSVVDYFYIMYEENLVGFLKINYQAALEDFPNKSICELEKMYIYRKFKGNGIGKIALYQLIDIVQQKGIQILFLGVLNTNESAISFYKRVGFKYLRTTRLTYTYFQEALKGLDLMYMEINQ